MVLRFFFLGLAFFFMSCTDVERDSPYDPESINYRGGSSSSSVAIYAVTYNAGIGVTGVTVPANQTKTYDVALILSSAVPVRTGYTFAGWNILANGSGTSYKSGDSYTANTGVTLYAQWYQAGPSVSYGGETYKTVVIGSQTWMARNLNYNVEGSKCYENKESYCDTYGRLYDWYAAIAVCPEGWHLPSDDEWGALIQYVNPSCSLTNDCANAGTKLKSASGWNIGGNGTDYYGFAALPGGHGNSDGFSNVGYFGSWWSATEDDAGYYAYLRDMSYYEVVYRSHYGKYGLSSVRCLQDNSSVATYTVTYNAGTGVTGVTVPANQTKTHDAALTLSTAVPTRTGYTFAGWNTSSNGSGMSYASGASYVNNAGVTLYAQWYQAGPPVSYGGETYQTVVIGSQTWMARNLNYDVSGSKCYNDSPSNCATYGRLYNWETAMDLPDCGYGTSCGSQIGAKHRGICPSGWHIPSDAEWTTLTDYVGGSSTTGKKLKATSGWNNNGNGTDEFGFAALPGGHGYSGGDFSNVGYYGVWWSATESSANDAYYRSVSFGIEYVYNLSNNKDLLLSVRCLQD